MMPWFDPGIEKIPEDIRPAIRESKSFAAKKIRSASSLVKLSLQCRRDTLSAKTIFSQLIDEVVGNSTAFSRGDHAICAAPISTHMLRSSHLVSLLSSALNDLSPLELKALPVALSLHDIGKTFEWTKFYESFPYEESGMSPARRRAYHLHVPLSLEIVVRLEQQARKLSGGLIADAHPEENEFFHHVKEGIMYHHERVDGMGLYGISGDSIPRIARYLSIIESLDTEFARLSRANSQHPVEPRETLCRFEQKGGRYDLNIVEKFRAPIGTLSASDWPKVHLEDINDYWKSVDNDDFHQGEKSPSFKEALLRLRPPLLR